MSPHWHSRTKTNTIGRLGVMAGGGGEEVHLPPKTATNLSSRYRICLMYIRFLAFKRFLRKEHHSRVVASSRNSLHQMHGPFSPPRVRHTGLRGTNPPADKGWLGPGFSAPAALPQKAWDEEGTHQADQFNPFFQDAGTTSHLH